MHEKAIKDFTTFLESNQTDPHICDIYYNRGIAYGKSGNIEQANKDLAKAEELGCED